MIKQEAHLHSWMLDKTGMINTHLLNLRDILQQEQLIIRGVLDEVLQVHKILPGCKEEGITWLLHENTNRILNRIRRNNKSCKAKDLIDKLGADIVAYNKHRQNLRHLDNYNRWNQLFKGEEAEV
jgi:hypothetical protein